MRRIPKHLYDVELKIYQCSNFIFIKVDSITLTLTHRIILHRTIKTLFSKIQRKSANIFSLNEALSTIDLGLAFSIFSK